MDNDGSLTPVKEFNMSWALSARGLYSTVEDMLKWTSIYDSSSLLSENSKTQMQTPFLKNYAIGVLVTQFNNETKISHGGRTLDINCFSKLPCMVTTADLGTSFFCPGQFEVN